MTIPSSHTVVRLLKRPRGMVEPGKDLVSLKESTQELTSSFEKSVNGIILKVLYLSLDPAQRGWMDNVRSYLPPVKLNSVMRGSVIAQVVQTKDEKFRVNELVMFTGRAWAEYIMTTGKSLEKVKRPPNGIDVSALLGPLGGTGMTAFFGLTEIGKPKNGDVVLVSGAAGATGSMVCQIAKVYGCKVIGIAGGEEKCKWLTKEFGCDAAVDYKKFGNLHDSRNAHAFGTELRKALKACGKKRCDIYFDNVGGPMLDEALKLLAFNARVVICGAISGYNDSGMRYGPKNYLNLLVTRSTMTGFLVFDYIDQYSKARAQLAEWIQRGEIKYKMDVREGLNEAPNHFLSLFGRNGGNKGKLCVRVDQSTSRSKL